MNISFINGHSMVWSPIREVTKIAVLDGRQVGSFGPSGWGVYAYVAGWAESINWFNYEQWQRECLAIEHSVNLLVTSWGADLAVKCAPEDELVIEAVCATAVFNPQHKLYTVKKKDLPHLQYIAHNWAERPALYGISFADQLGRNPQSPL